MRKLIYQGSVKNLYQVNEGILFEFSDKYSIYDWGEMPDKIDKKGSNLAKITANLFEEISKAKNFQNLQKPDFLTTLNFEKIINSEVFNSISSLGFSNHFLRKESENEILVRPVDIFAPKKHKEEYNYDVYKDKPTGALIPLEVVFRFGAPQGSSFLKRNPNTAEGSFFDDIIIEFYTKLEPKDRLLTYEEAQSISNLNDGEFSELITRSKILSLFLQNKFAQTPLKLWDGKFEFAFGEVDNQGNREIILVDTIGPDELRLTLNDIPFSKEFLRQAYQDTTWLNYFQETKSKDRHPLPLDPLYINLAQSIYSYIAQVITKNDFTFPNELKELINRSKIIVLGKGGREHALAKHLSQSPFIKEVYVIPGNPGIEGTKFKSINISKEEIVSFCKAKEINYVVIGPEDLLSDGLTDELQKNQIPVASPSKAASLLEASKAFAKDFMEKFNIPTALYKNFKNKDLALNYIEELDSEKIVVKLSGLAAGKGVVLCHSKDEAKRAVNELSPNNEELVIEEFLEGREFSYFALCMGENYKILGTACDYKRLNDNDLGPNTGGMGCYSPTYWLNATDEQLIKESIVERTLMGMKEEGRSFTGTLFIGIMMTSDGPKVLEYNVRFGDPETQTILPRLKSNIHPILEAMAYGDVKKFNNSNISFSPLSSVHIVKAAKGYPGLRGEKIEKDQPISISKNKELSELYFAGVKKENNQFLTNGGRVLGMTTLANTLDNAKKMAYNNIEYCKFLGEQFRGDIGE